MGKYTNWLGHHRNVRLLQAASCLRNVCQGIALVDVSLYLNELGWSGGQIGGLFAAAALFRTTAIYFARELTGLLGVRRYVMLFELIAAIAAAGLALSGNAAIMGAAVIVAGFGSGHTGSGGLVGPIERAWLGAYASKKRDLLFGLHAALGYGGLAAGCLLAGLPVLWRSGLTDAFAYRPLFGFIGLLSLVCLYLVYRVTGGERKRRGQGQQAAGEPREAAGGRHAGLVHTVNGIAVTLAGTMTSYWLTARFGAAANEIGVVMALSYGSAGAVAVIGMRTAERYGSIRSVVGMQLAGVAVLAVLPWISSFWLAALFSAASTALNLGTRGNRNVVITDHKQRHRRTWRTQVQSFIMRLSVVLWPGAFGRLIEHGHWIMPFYVAAAVQLAATLWFARSQKAIPEQHSSAAHEPASKPIPGERSIQAEPAGSAENGT